jgi:hypothetical protein
MTLFMFLGIAEAHAWSWGEKNLVTIDDKEFTSQDFRDWWQSWREKDMPLPKNLDPYIEWNLLAREAETMELYREPSFQRKINVFLKVRSLMLLKNDAIDSKIDISESDLHKEYRTQHTPLWNVQAFYFMEQKDADKAYTDLTSAVISPADLKGRVQPDDSSVQVEERWFRPQAFKNNKEWLDVVSKLKTGGIAAPFSMGDKFVVIHLLETKGPDEEDFKLLKEGIRRELSDTRSAELNSRFFEDLRKKYSVAINYDILDKAGQGDISAEILDKPVITSNRMDVPLRHYQEKLQAELNVQGKQNAGDKEKEAIKIKVLNGILSQTLTTWESLDRHYVEKPPLKPVFEFYKQHRLIKELEGKVFDNMITVGDNDIKQYYRKNLKEFTPLEMVSLAMWEGGEEIAARIYDDISRGVDFFAAVSNHSDLKVPVTQVPYNHLDPVVQKKIDTLVNGDVSAPFKKGSLQVIVKLINRQPSSPAPLEKVQAEIAEKIHEQRYKDVKAEYLEQLKQRSAIIINRKAWNRLQKELGE